MLDRPEAMNALNTAMAARLAQVCAEIAADLQVRAVVLAAAGEGTAADAGGLGLADRRVPPGTAGEHALALARQIAGNSPVAVLAAKRAIRQGSGVSLAVGLEVEDAAWRAAAFSGDRREGIAAF